MNNFRKYSTIFVLLMLLPVFISGCGAWRSRKDPRVITSRQDPISRLSAIPIFPEETEFEVPRLADYRIGIDDLIEVFMFRHPDLSRDVIVRPDGKISYLLIGDVQAKGLTVQELDDAITEKFEKYAADSLKEPMEAPIKGEYRINLGDELSISVWKEPDLSTKAIVRPDGRISYYLLGDMKVYKKTIPEVSKEFTEKLREYIKEPYVSIAITRFGEIQGMAYIAGFISMYIEQRPDISVLVKKFGSRKVIVLGRVNAPGIYDLEGNAKLLDAIGYAEGFTNDAVKDNIFVIRGNTYSAPTVIKVNVWDIIRRGNYALNIPLQDQDIVYSPRSIVGNYNVLVSQIKPTVDLLKKTCELQADLETMFRLD